MLLPWFEWLEATGPGVLVRESLWLFPAIQSVHLIALALIGGAVLLVDLRLLGFGLVGLSVSSLGDAVRPWFRASLLTLIVTGLLLLSSEALRCYYSPPFWWKMYFLGAAILFSGTIRRWVVARDDLERSKATAIATALASVVLWTGVGVSGRWIAFY